LNQLSIVCHPVILILILSEAKDEAETEIVLLDDPSHSTYSPAARLQRTSGATQTVNFNGSK
jgi:hypothetical protein